MSAPVRFLVVALAGWALFRGVTAGMLPGVEVFTSARAEATPPPFVPTQFPPIAPVQPQAPVPLEPYASAAYPGYPAYYPSQPAYPPYAGYAPPYPQPRYVTVPVYYPTPQIAVTALPPRQSMPVAPEAPPEFYAPIPPIESWDVAQIGTQKLPDWNGGSSSASPPVPVPSFIPRKMLDRMSLDAWALLRGTSGTGSLASGGTLGGSQAGARLTYRFDPRMAASLRWSSPVGGSRGGEAAAGVRFTPVPSIPISITAERRQAGDRYSTGRSDFALFAEGGVYQRPLGWNLLLDGYAQAGVVGLQTRDLFADGGLAVSRPVWGRFSVGAGAWGGYQPGLYRVDAGPRVSMRVRENVNLHLDWRQRLAGTAEPASGPALTLGASF